MDGAAELGYVCRMKFFTGLFLVFAYLSVHAQDKLVCYRLLGEKGTALEYSTNVSRVSPAWLDHHLVGSTDKALAVYPAAAYLDGILAAIMSQPERAKHETIVLENVEIPSALPLLPARREKPPAEATIKTTLVPNAGGYSFSIASRGEHMKGQAFFAGAFAPIPPLLQTLGKDLPPAELYAALAKRGLPYGETFRLVQKVTVSGATSVGLLTPHASLDFSQHFIHPTTTDSALHTVAAILIANPTAWEIPEQFRNSIALPVGFDRVQASAKNLHQLRGNFTTEANITGVKTHTDGDLKVTVKYDLVLRDEEGAVVLQITGGRLLFR